MKERANKQDDAARVWRVWFEREFFCEQASGGLFVFFVSRDASVGRACEVYVFAKSHTHPPTPHRPLPQRRKQHARSGGGGGGGRTKSQKVGLKNEKHTGKFFFWGGDVLK